MLLFGSEAMWNFKFAFIPGITPITGEVCRCAGVIRVMDAHACSQQWMGMVVMDPILILSSDVIPRRSPSLYQTGKRQSTSSEGGA